MTNEIVQPASKTQVQALIDLCLRGGFNEAAGLFQLGSQLLSDAVKEADEKPETCTCYEFICDNPLCPDHGHLYQCEFTPEDEQERNELYTMGMGA